jgi:hypothetical protein
MSGGEATTLKPAALQGLRIGIAQGLPLRGLDEVVASRLFEAVSELGRVGVQLSPELFPQFDDMVRANARGSIAVAEAYAIHRERLAMRGAEFDPFVRSRVERGREISAADYIVLIRDRAAMVRAMDARLADRDAIVMPTCSIAAPTIADCRDPESALTRNQMALRNAAIVNFFDLCAISLPPRGGGLPVGLMRPRAMARIGGSCGSRPRWRICSAPRPIIGVAPRETSGAPPDARRVFVLAGRQPPRRFECSGRRQPSCDGTSRLNREVARSAPST